MTNTGPFYFALVDPTDKTFDHTRHALWDFEIFSFKRTLEEGQMPKLELVIQNPYRGLLTPTAKVWAHFSFHDVPNNVWYPLFFGRLIGQPQELDGSKITVELIGWPLDYVLQKQQVSASLKVDPFYDKVCIAVKDRDNPDTILETYTKLYHIDHLSLHVTVSDIINAEDGNVNFTADQAFYNFLQQTIDQPPLTSIQMLMDVSWTQTWRGYVQIPTQTYNSYGGDGIIQDWPKPLTKLGGGYTVAFAETSDNYRLNAAQTVSFTYSWNNPETTHSDGDTLSLNINVSFPVFAGPALQYIIWEVITPGFLDPFGVDFEGDPAPTNRPSSSETQTMYAPEWSVTGSMTLLAEASRQRTERVVMTLNGNFQPILVDPTVQQDSETITLSLADVGVPIIDLLDFTSIAGTAVGVGTVIFPDFLSVPSGTTTQVVTTPGTAAPFGFEPAFSDIPGVTTTDINGVVYTSLGTTNPTDGNADWQADIAVAAGTIILPRQPLVITWVLLQHPGAVAFPPTGAQVSLGQKVRGSNGSYWVCTLPGITQLTEPHWTTSWGDTIIDGGVRWRGLGMTIPTGNDFFLALTTGTTGPLWLTPQFNNSALHAQTVDNGVTWVYIGTGNIPAGGTTTSVTSGWYFPGNGQRSLRYGIAKMRARMLARARCAVTKFQVSFMAGINLTLRMSSTVNDIHIPGGICVGKNTHIELSGSAGRFRTDVTIKSCVGFDTTITPVLGTGVYAQSGVLDDPNVQQMDGSVVVLPTLTDVGYTPPVPSTVDDGVTFPITDPASIIITDTVQGNLADQATGIMNSFKAASAALGFPFQHIATTVNQLVAQQQAIAVLNAQTVGLALSKAPIWRDLQLKPLDAGPYGAYYNVVLSTLQGPKQIDTQASSNG